MATNPKQIQVNVSSVGAQVLPVNADRKFLLISNPDQVTPVNYKLGSNFNVVTSEVQKINFDQVPTGGTWTISFGASTTGALAFNADAATIQTALNGLASITGPGGSVVVTGNYSNGFVVTFATGLANAPRALLVIASNSLVNSLVQQSSIQLLTFGLVPQAGNFQLAFGGNQTPNLAFNISAAALRTALNLLASINNGVSAVTQDGVTKAFTITMAAAPLANAPQALITVPVNTLTNSAGIASDVQVLFAQPAPLQGNFQLMVGNQTTTLLPYNTNAAAIQSALEALSTVGVGNVLVTGAAFKTGFTMTFRAALANTVVPKVIPYMPTIGAALHPDTLQPPYKRVNPDVLMQVNRTVTGVGPAAVTTAVSSLQAGIAPANVAVTVVETTPGLAASNDGVQIGTLDFRLFQGSTCPEGALFMQSANPVQVVIFEG